MYDAGCVWKLLRDHSNLKKKKYPDAIDGTALYARDISKHLVRVENTTRRFERGLGIGPVVEEASNELLTGVTNDVRIVGFHVRLWSTEEPIQRHALHPWTTFKLGIRPRALF